VLATVETKEKGFLGHFDKTCFNDVWGQKPNRMSSRENMNEAQSRVKSTYNSFQ
jgi:hypothetical protein